MPGSSVSLANEIGPLVLMLQPGSADNMLIRIGSSNVSGALEFIEGTWEDLFPGHPFEYSFLDDDLSGGYTNIKQSGRLLDAFAVLAIVIASLGLFGLASFTAEQRTKEIGIRKVLGSSTSGIVVLLTREFTKCLVISTVIACPAGYMIMRHWLKDFAYRVNMDVWMFAVPVLATAIISVIAVSYQSIRAATSDPVDSLMYE
ncbi:MAG: hypothetical protein KOO63_06700 [Bacteroidales bacterium]|nr:hypothetical protein [Candidatus Latescibacterota bacterium]